MLSGWPPVRRISALILSAHVSSGARRSAHSSRSFRAFTWWSRLAHRPLHLIRRCLGGAVLAAGVLAPVIRASAFIGSHPPDGGRSGFATVRRGFFTALLAWGFNLRQPIPFGAVRPLWKFGFGVPARHPRPLSALRFLRRPSSPCLVFQRALFLIFNYIIIYYNIS